MADVAVSSDPRIDSVHFEIQTFTDRAIVRDLESKHGTFVNKLAAGEIELSDGDFIKAGNTQFRVGIDAPSISQATQGNASVDSAMPEQVKADSTQDSSSVPNQPVPDPVSYTHLTLPTKA